MDKAKGETISGLLEQDRSLLLEQLRTAGLPERAEQAVDNELSRMLLRYNEGCTGLRQRAAASAMMETLRASLGLLQSRGEVRIWTREMPPPEWRIRPAEILLPALGLLLHVAAFVLLLRGTAGTVFPGLLLLGGMGADLAGGFRIAAARKSPEPERWAEALTDWEQVYGTLHTAALVMDRNLAETAAGERLELQAADSGGVLDGPSLELLGALLEAAYSKDGAFALEQLRKIRHYLHGKDIELLEYAADTATRFDILPGLEPVTLRPALVRDGHLLLRGLAAGEII